MPDELPATLARIDENVKYLRESFDEHKEHFDEHVKKDERLLNEFTRPLWEESLLRKGADKNRNYMGALAGWCINAGIAFAAAWAAVKAFAGPGSHSP